MTIKSPHKAYKPVKEVLSSASEVSKRLLLSALGAVGAIISGVGAVVYYFSVALQIVGDKLIEPCDRRNKARRNKGR